MFLIPIHYKDAKDAKDDWVITRVDPSEPRAAVFHDVPNVLDHLQIARYHWVDITANKTAILQLPNNHCNYTITAPSHWKFVVLTSDRRPTLWITVTTGRNDVITSTN